MSTVSGPGSACAAGLSVTAVTPGLRVCHDLSRRGHGGVPPERTLELMSAGPCDSWCPLLTRAPSVPPHSYEPGEAVTVAGGQLTARPQAGRREEGRVQMRPGPLAPQQPEARGAGPPALCSWEALGTPFCGTFAHVQWEETDSDLTEHRGGGAEDADALSLVPPDGDPGQGRAAAGPAQQLGDAARAGTVASVLFLSCVSAHGLGEGTGQCPRLRVGRVAMTAQQVLGTGPWVIRVGTLPGPRGVLCSGERTRLPAFLSDVHASNFCAALEEEPHAACLLPSLHVC